MFERAQKQATAKAGVKPATLHSIAAMLRDRRFTGRFDAGGVTYGFTYSPDRASLAVGKLQLTGSLTVTPGGSANSAGFVNSGGSGAARSPRTLRDVQATLLAAQGGIGAAPQRTRLPVDLPASRPDLAVVESTGSLSFCGALFFKLSRLDGRALGVAADMRQLQLNVRLAPVSDTERELQGIFSTLVDALYGGQLDEESARVAVRQLNKLLTGS
jgi:hypothetical protein